MARFTVEFEGLTLRCEQDGLGEIYADLRLPSRGRMGFNDATGVGGIYSAQVTSAEDRALHDRLTVDVTQDLRTFRAIRPDLAAAIRAAAPVQVPAPAPEPDPLAWSETLAMLDSEGTPMAPAAVLARGRRRTCVECGSPMYGDRCTHCMEG